MGVLQSTAGPECVKTKFESIFQVCQTIPDAKIIGLKRVPAGRFFALDYILRFYTLWAIKGQSTMAAFWQPITELLVRLGIK